MIAFGLIVGLASLTPPDGARGASPTTIGEPVVVGEVSHHPRAIHAFQRWSVSFAAYPNGPAWLRMFDSAGVQRVEVYDPPASDLHHEPAVAAGLSNILVVYCLDEYPSTGYALVAVLYDAAGTPLHRLELATSEDFPYYDAAVANQPDTDRFLVVYRHDAGTARGTHAWGVAVETDTGQIVASGTHYDYGIAIGPPDVAYGQKEIVSGVYAQRYLVVFRPGGTGTEVRAQVTTTTGGLYGSGFDLTNFGDEVRDPKTAAERSGHDHDFVVVWSHGLAPDPMCVVAQRLNANGALLGTTFEVASPNAPDADVAASDTEYLIAFRDYPDETTQHDRIRGRYCSFTGSLLLTEFTIAQDLGAFDREPSVASDGTNFAVAYLRDDGNPYHLTVLLQRVGAGAFTYVPGDVSAASHLVRGVAWGDSYEPANGLPDLYAAVSGTGYCLYFANEDGILEEVLAPGLYEVLSGQGAAWADYDHDGLLDLYVTSDTGPNELYHCNNSSSPNYSAVGAALGVADTGNGRSIAWGDYDGDGWLDLYVANKLTANCLYRNLGGAGFTNVAAALGVADAGNTEGVAFIDFDNDRDLDIYVGNTGGANRLYQYDGAAFTDVAAAWGVSDAGSARSVTWADYDDDGDFDLYVSKYSAANSFYRRDAASFSDVAAALGLDDAGRGESACWADIDLDGDLDLFLANYLGASRLYRSENHGASFTEVGAFVGLDYDGPSVGAAWADYDDDGDPDLCLGGWDGLTRIYRNDYAPAVNHYLKVRLVGDDAPACAIGARVRCVAGGLVQVREVDGGNGYLSQNDRTLIFGLGSEADVDTLEVRWLGGGLDRFLDLDADQTQILLEGTGVTATEDPPALPAAACLLGNRPNPFNPGTTIAFALPEPSAVELAIYDARGRLVIRLVAGERPAGRHEIVWNGQDGRGRDMPSGAYLCRLTTAKRVDTRPLALVR